jgi:uncharacterized Ntn-hydrolase superfamily protein
MRHRNYDSHELTYSIVALDGDTGELGVAVQSHYFHVGPVVPWALAGVGAVATQSHVNISFGPLGLEFLKDGYTAQQALTALLAGDDKPDMRQLAIVDASGNVAAHTGPKCIPAAGHKTGDGFSCQANLMEKDTVWGAMFDAYTSAQGPLAERMLAALDAAEAEGGDIRGRQSAAMLVVRGNPSGRSWEDRIIDLRVDDSRDPLLELRRLLRIKRAYASDDAAERLEVAGDVKAAARLRMEAADMAPDLVELSFWAGLDMAKLGDVDGGCRLIARALAEEPRWMEALNRLAAVDWVDKELVEKIQSQLAATAGRR